MDLEKILEEKLKIKYEENINSYIQLVSNWFAYIILNNEKYIVDNSLDPTWDHSGRVVSADWLHANRTNRGKLCCGI